MDIIEIFGKVFSNPVWVTINRFSIYIYLGIIIIVLILLYSEKANDKQEMIVEFYPPEGINSAELAALYKDMFGVRDVMSLLVFLAGKGYISISEKYNVGEFFIFTKLKEYDGDNINERNFMKVLFEDTEEVDIYELESRFFPKLDTIRSMILSQLNGKKMIKPSLRKKIAIILSIITPVFILSNTFSIKEIGSDIQAINFFTVFFSGVLLIASCGYFLGKMKNKYMKILVLIVIFFFWIVSLNKDFYLFDFIRYILGYITLLFIAKVMPNFKNRVEIGNHLYERICGFKHFLEIAEKDRLEALVEENPKYFYDILPYTYVFGISDKWIKKFEGIAVPPITFNDGRTINSFDYSRYGIITDHILTNYQNTISVSHSSNDSGSSFRSSGSSSRHSSSGGHSGGGVGGGGGRSW